MGTAARGKFPALIQDLLEHAPDYDYFQALSLLEACCAGPKPGRSGLAAPVKLRPAPEISFPAADIRRCTSDGQGRFDFELNFLGLYGVDGPLPHFFLEAVAGQDDPGKALRAFLDVFNQRLYQLLFLGWRKLNDHGRMAPGSLYDRYLGALAGGGAGEGQSLAYAGLLGGRVKNAEGLLGLLEDFLRMPVAVRQHQPCWVPLARRPGLGSAGADPLVLGENCSLGDRVLDVSRKILIRIGPISSDQSLELLPGQARAGDLATLIRQYLHPTIEFDLELLIAAEPGPPLQLGRQPAILGWGAPLGERDARNYRIRLAGSTLQPTGPAAARSKPANH